MWNANVSITNNTEYTISLTNSFLPENTVTSNGGTFNWSTSDSPNTSSFKFWILETQDPLFQGGLYFGEDCGVWADRGYMEVPNVIMDADVNGIIISQELNGGQTIVEDFSMGGNISITFSSII